MSSQGTVDSPQVELIRSFVRQFENMDVEKLVTFLHKDLRRVTYPRSLVPVVPITQISSLTKTRIGVEMDREMLLIAHVVTDDDGSLKIKQLEEFVDSVAYREFYQAVHTAKANGLCSGSFAAA
ncbi:hypothetical protein BJ322DRAFT_1221577 [Thelephora terrestris]|uniref:Uncharacterized protein n=1 Tax=Thelephora terrestris TaxID=56493 RepID=A0A9P6H4V4_9AGAM|nr:hypothetical protein BJ322DRAFT_1221577 [Thelephora terrestris]